MTGAGEGYPLRPTRPWIWPLAVSAAALIFWVVFLGQAEDSVFGRVPILDEVYYLDQAADWAVGPVPPANPFFVSPLYPLLIVLAGGAGGVPDNRVYAPADLRGIRLMQVFCWCLVVVLLRLTAGRVLGRDLDPGWPRELVVWMPAVLFALYRPAAVYAVSILLELPLLALITGIIFLMTVLADPAEIRRTRGRTLFLLLLLGLTLGLAGLLRGTALLLLVPAMAAAGTGSARWGRFGAALLVLAVALAVMAPAAIHNSRISGRLTGPTLNAGVNLYIGNGPQANGFYVAVVPGDWRRDPAGRHFLADRLGGPTPTLAEADRIWRDEAWRTITENPGRTAGLWLKKVWLHLQGWEIDQLTPLTRWRAAAPALAWLPVPFALVVALGLGGMAARWRHLQVRWWVAAVGVLVAGQSLFFVVSRYRLALVPVFCLLAVAGGLEIKRKNRGVILVTLLAVVVTIPWGLAETRQMWRAQALANEAVRWAEVAEAEDSAPARETAVELYRAALVGKAAGPAPWLGLAALVREGGQPEEAAVILTEGAAANPGNLEIKKVLMVLFLQDGRRAEALKLSGRILEDHPRDADTLHNRTLLLAEEGRPEEAMALARNLIAAHRTDARGYIDLGIILARTGQRDEARKVFEQGLAAVPGHPQLQHNLDQIHP